MLVKEFNTICKGPIFSRVQILSIFIQRKIFTIKVNVRVVLWYEGCVLCTVILSDIYACVKLPNWFRRKCVCSLKMVARMGNFALCARLQVLGSQRSAPKKNVHCIGFFCKLLIDLQSWHSSSEVFLGVSTIFLKNLRRKNIGNLFWEFACSIFLSVFGARYSVLGSFAFWLGKTVRNIFRFCVNRRNNVFIHTTSISKNQKFLNWTLKWSYKNCLMFAWYDFQSIHMNN